MSDNSDVDVEIDVKKGTARATVTAWAAGVTAIIGAVGYAFYAVSQAAFAIIALFLNYEDVGFGDAHARHSRPAIEQQAKDKEFKKENRDIANPSKLISGSTARNASYQDRR